MKTIELFLKRDFGDRIYCLNEPSKESHSPYFVCFEFIQDNFRVAAKKIKISLSDSPKKGFVKVNLDNRGGKICDGDFYVSIKSKQIGTNPFYIYANARNWLGGKTEFYLLVEPA